MTVAVEMNPLLPKPIVWTIAGSDSGGGAGIQADLQTFRSFDVHGCSVITAVTSQNSHSVTDIHYIHVENIISQIEALAADLPAKAIKLGMLGNKDSLEKINDFLAKFSGKVVLDPVLVSTSGNNLFKNSVNEYIACLRNMFRHIDVITPNLVEAEHILGRKLPSYADVESAAQELLSFGVKSVLIKGGHAEDTHFSQDFWTNGSESFWLACQKQPRMNYHGSGCTLSAAITACLGLGYDIQDALVIAKSYVTQGIRGAQRVGQGPAPVAHVGWPKNEDNLPTLSAHALTSPTAKFPDCGSTPLGLYPIVDTTVWLEKLLPLGVTTIQLRIKNKTGSELENEIQSAVALAKQYGVRLFINDYWELAIKHGAYGVHLGQEDLLTADIKAIRSAGLRLGISAHSYYELARAHAFKPSYLGFGPIYPTLSKEMSYTPQGISKLKQWRAILNYPLVAIGGITIERLPDVLAARVDGIAMISAITYAKDPLEKTRKVLQIINTCANPINFL